VQGIDDLERRRRGVLQVGVKALKIAARHEGVPLSFIALHERQQLEMKCG
jgi:hypothetical protein